MNYLIEVNNIKKLIVDGKIDIVEKIIVGRSNEIDLLLSKYKSLEKENSLGVIYRSDYQVESSKVILSLLKSIDVLKEDFSSGGMMFDLYSYFKEEFENNLKPDVSRLSNDSFKSLSVLLPKIESTQNEELENIYTEIISTETVSNDSNLDMWYDRPIKSKIKLTLPLLFVKIEREYDISDFKFPRTLSDLKKIFIK